MSEESFSARRRRRTDGDFHSTARFSLLNFARNASGFEPRYEKMVISKCGTCELNFLEISVDINLKSMHIAVIIATYIRTRKVLSISISGKLLSTNGTFANEHNRYSVRTSERRRKKGGSGINSERKCIAPGRIAETTFQDVPSLL